MNFATSTICQETKQWGRLTGVYYIQHSLASDISAFVGREVKYMYIHVGISALLVSTDRGNAKAYRPWNEQQAGSTFFISVYPKVFENALKETEG